jgi:large subunit ribosomal protein L19
MDSKVIRLIEKDQLKKKIVNFNVGDSISVHSVIDVDKEGKERIQVFKGIVIKTKGSGMGKTFIVRKISHAGVGVEKTFPLNSPTVKKIEFIKKGKVRRAKLYYMRGRTGKSALKILEGTLTAKELAAIEEAMSEEKVEEAVVEVTEGSTEVREPSAEEKTEAENAPAAEEAVTEEVPAETEEKAEEAKAE